MVFPDTLQPALLAAVRDGGHKPPTPHQLRLLQAIPTRRTNRRPFADAAVDPSSQHALRQAALEEGSWLQLIEEPAQRRTLQQWPPERIASNSPTPPSSPSSPGEPAPAPTAATGVPASAGDPSPRPRTSGRYATTATVRRHAGTRQDFEHEPVLAVLSPYLAGPVADIRTGQALQRVLLTATVLGLSVSFLSQLVEVPTTCEELRRLITSTRPPLAVLRIGRGYPVPATPRRDVADLVIPEPADIRG